MCCMCVCVVCVFGDVGDVLFKDGCVVVCLRVSVVDVVFVDM